jgi:sugar transferase (PEP-CTERM/EpsH1 system associated)
VAKILYLVHRLPYPPNKGDKVRSYHLLRHLAERHQVYLGTFVDDPDDEQHVDTLRQWCADVHAVRLHPLRARISSLAGLLGQGALTLRYYRSADLRHWVDQTLARESIGTAVVFSSSMAQYAEGRKGLQMLVDFVDVDSAKWTAYADRHPWPMSRLYLREGQALLTYERKIACQSERAFFVTEAEVGLFSSLAPECAHRLQVVGNGVDADFFCPDPARESPFAASELPLVFTGAMDYWPNIDAVQWFVAEMLPRLRDSWPNARFHIVGRSPSAAVRALASEAVNVTGTVPDVRPFLQHAAAVVAPLRLARGIQNKVLEAMAMARPVVAAGQCVGPIHATPGVHLLAATAAQDYVESVASVLRDRKQAIELGDAARAYVLARFGWAPRLAPLIDLAARGASRSPRHAERGIII